MKAHRFATSHDGKPMLLGIAIIVLALAGCDHRTAHYGSDPAPQVDHDGMRIAVQSFRQTGDSLRIRMKVANDTSDTLTFKGAKASEPWVLAQVGGQEFAGKATLWDNHGYPDDQSGVWSQEDVSKGLDISLHRSCEVELDFRFPKPFTSTDLPWSFKIQSWPAGANPHWDTVHEPATVTH